MAAAQRLEQEFRDSLEQLPPFRHALVGCSGGADSTALCLLLQKALADREEADTPSLRVAIVDHGLRSVSRQEAETCQQRLRERGFTVDVLCLNAPNILKANIQATARHGRFQKLLGHAQQIGADCLMLAHHHDDQLETVLDRLRRGSHTVGLSAISRLRVQQGVRIMRPLLGMEGASLRAYCQENDMLFVDDPSNTNLRFTRVKSRFFLKQNPSIKSLLQRLQIAAMPSAGLELAATRQLMSFVHQPLLGIVFAKEDILAAPASILHRLLGSILRYVCQSDYLPRYQKIIRFAETLKAHKTTCLAGVQVRYKDNGFWFVREKAKLPPMGRVAKGERLLWDQRWGIIADQDILIEPATKAMLLSDMPKIPTPILISQPSIQGEILRHVSGGLSGVFAYHFAPQTRLGEDLQKSGLLFDEIYPISFT